LVGDFGETGGDVGDREGVESGDVDGGFSDFHELAGGVVEWSDSKAVVVVGVEMGDCDDFSDGFFGGSSNKLIAVGADVDSVGGGFSEEFHMLDDFGVFFVFVDEWREFKVDGVGVFGDKDGGLGPVGICRPDSIVEIHKGLGVVGEFIGEDFGVEDGAEDENGVVDAVLEQSVFEGLALLEGGQALFQVVLFVLVV
jgi:hypothetical protein